MSSKHILLVEDEEHLLKTIQLNLELEGYTVSIANNGIEGVKKVQHNRYDIILMDIQMPVMDGYEATRQIRLGESGEASNKAIIIAMTANAMEGDKQKCIESGMDIFITKPVRINELTSVLRRAGLLV